MEKQPPSVNKLAGQYSFLDGEEPLTLTKKQLQSTLMAASLIYAYQQTYPKIRIRIKADISLLSHVFCSSSSSSSPRCSAPRPSAPEKPPNYRHPFPAGNPAKLGGFLLLFLFLNLEISPSLLQIFGSALLCSVLLRAAFAGGVLPGFLVCREFLHSSPRRLPSQPDPVLLAGVSWFPIILSVSTEIECSVLYDYCTEHDWFEMKLSSLVLSRACLFGID
ncbi:hypothetical protein SLEP1_g39810 [Rubroshorea leprosula]|uniref:Uncharacterized protein n=1 Tax=Rubroshorea leprosula TaxID=152421 RepID=A0AAV5L1N2_9ROSI|nr:hypothetical protein SLEP1_g39810 [Rubroshorea leprosula]